MELCDVLDGPGWSDGDFSPERGNLAGKHWGKLGTFETVGTLFNGNIRNITCSIHIYIYIMYIFMYYIYIYIDEDDEDDDDDDDDICIIYIYILYT